MAESIPQPDRPAVEKFLRERYELQWSDDVFGIDIDSVTAHQNGGERSEGVIEMTIVARCSLEDAFALREAGWK